ncbi:hypothetical protein [Enterovibrio norvegicus]|uniref:hypothetical protein n=1 Tax=Enterovibrio norvegicus TaxID=188144 RepID=UPI00352DF1A3
MKRIATAVFLICPSFCLFASEGEAYIPISGQYKVDFLVEQSIAQAKLNAIKGLGSTYEVSQTVVGDSVDTTLTKKYKEIGDSEVIRSDIVPCPADYESVMCAYALVKVKLSSNMVVESAKASSIKPSPVSAQRHVISELFSPFKETLASGLSETMDIHPIDWNAAERRGNYYRNIETHRKALSGEIRGDAAFVYRQLSDQLAAYTEMQISQTKSRVFVVKNSIDNYDANIGFELPKSLKGPSLQFKPIDALCDARELRLCLDNSWKSNADGSEIVLVRTNERSTGVFAWNWYQALRGGSFEALLVLTNSFGQHFWEYEDIFGRQSDMYRDSMSMQRNLISTPGKTSDGKGISAYLDDIHGADEFYYPIGFFRNYGDSANRFAIGFGGLSSHVNSKPKHGCELRSECTKGVSRKAIESLSHIEDFDQRLVFHRMETQLVSKTEEAVAATMAFYLPVEQVVRPKFKTMPDSTLASELVSNGYRMSTITPHTYLK